MKPTLVRRRYGDCWTADGAATLPAASNTSGIMVLTITDDQVATITGFPNPDLFPIFDFSTTT
jgi:hypothetical protein